MHCYEMLQSSGLMKQHMYPRHPINSMQLRNVAFVVMISPDFWLNLKQAYILVCASLRVWETTLAVQDCTQLSNIGGCAGFILLSR